MKKIKIITILIIIILIIFLPIIIFIQKNNNNTFINLNCLINDKTVVVKKGNGFIIVKNILEETCRKDLINLFFNDSIKNKNLNEDKNLSFYTNPLFLNNLSSIVGEQLFPVHLLDLQRCWIRYYFEGMKAQYYENYHHDVKRYNSSIKQYRLVIPLYDNSDTIFTINNHGEFPFKQNMGVFLEADNCLHKVSFTKGQRLLLIMDFITKDCHNLNDHFNCRGINGYYNWVKDVIWRNISSLYYKIKN